MEQAKFLIGGMDGAGKSTLCCSLYVHALVKRLNVSLYELDPWSDSHLPILGLKEWSDRRKRTAQEVSDQDFMMGVEAFKHDQAQVVIGDLPGRYQEPRLRFLKGICAIGVLVLRETTAKDEQSGYPQTQEGWSKLFDELEVPLGLTIHTTKTSLGDENLDIATKVANLDRRVVLQPHIYTLGQTLLDLAKVYSPV